MMKRKREGSAHWSKIGKPKKILSLIIFGLVLGIGVAFAFTSFSNYQTPPPELIMDKAEGQEPEAEFMPPPPTSVRRLTVLLIGVDSRPGEPSISNTDTLVVAQVNAQTGQIALLSVPRDTQVEIPRYGTGKINMAARVGTGLDTTKKVLEKLLGLKIDGYVLADFAGFKDTIDTLGGITLTVEKDMYYETGDQNDGIIDLKRGTQRLNGTQALQYARFRQDALADISRTMRQQAVLKAAAQEFIQLKTLPKLPKVIPQIVRAVKTDLKLTEMLAMANVMVRLEQAAVVSQTLPGNFVTEKGISYWQVNTQESKEVARDFFSNGKTVDVFSRRVSSQVAQGEEVKEKNLLPAKNGGAKKVKGGEYEQAQDLGLDDGAGREEGMEDRSERAVSAHKLDKVELENVKQDNAKLEKAQEGIIVEVEILAPPN